MIEVNDGNGLFIKHERIVVNRKEDIINSINKAQKRIIKKIFLPYVNIELLNDKDLIITQPLYIDNFLDSENDQILLYKNIIRKYCNNGAVIKVHPRDKIDYSSFKEEYVIRDKFPIEVLNYISDIKFNKVITISSTAINQINNCKEKIILGWDYLDKYKGEICNDKREKQCN